MNRSLALAIAAACFAASALSPRTPPICRAPIQCLITRRRKRRLAGPASTSASTAAMAGAARAGAIRRSAQVPGAFNTTGALFGGQLGYNWQTGPIVLGIETDADWTNIKGSTAGLGGVCVADGGGLCQTKQDWFGTTRGRIGYAFGRFMPYVTGGVAYGDIIAVATDRRCDANQVRLERRRRRGICAHAQLERQGRISPPRSRHRDFVQRGLQRVDAVGPRSLTTWCGPASTIIGEPVSSDAAPVRRPPPARPRAIRA